MKPIKNKKDISLFIESFETIAQRDEQGNKLYFVFEDRKRSGQWTLMKYPTNTFSVHGLGEEIHGATEAYCDENETTLDEKELIQFLWDNRGALNEKIRNEQKTTV